jgi:hypothetical protein
VREFAVEVVRERYLSGDMTPLSLGSFDAFFEQKSAIEPIMAEISPSTCAKIRQKTFQLLTEAGIITDARVVSGMIVGEKILHSIPSEERDWFPVFIKGNRQTNNHKRSQCIIENVNQYEALRKEWKQDRILSWQKIAVREYVKLQEVDSISFPNMVPISYEFRFFYFEGKCMAYGPYWYMGKKYKLPDEELQAVIELTDWAANRMTASFIAIDVAKTASGEWTIIEVNDAQESGFVGINPFELWNNTIEAMQNRKWISVEDFLEEGTVIMCGDPCPDKTPEDIWSIAKGKCSIQELVDAYVIAHNKFWWVEDEVYDYDEGTEEYNKACEITDAWAEVMDYLCDNLIKCASEDGILATGESHYGLKPFMEKYGYRDGHGWWVKL